MVCNVQLVGQVYKEDGLNLVNYIRLTQFLVCEQSSSVGLCKQDHNVCV